MREEDTFGEVIRRLRMERRITLRVFSGAIGMDPANYSKLERGILPPPRDPEKLDQMALALGLAVDSIEGRELRRLAALERGEVPRRLLEDKELAGKLPALFRTLEGDPVDDRVLDELIEAIRRE